MNSELIYFNSYAFYLSETSIINNMLKHFVGRKNARVFLGANFLKNKLFFNSLRMLTNIISPPKDRLNPDPVTLNVGDYATNEKEFTKEDLKLFSTAAQDKHAAHLNPDNIKTFYKSNIVYGILTSSMFTMVVRDLFPGAIYLDQTLKFKAPIHVDEKVTARLTVKEIREDKKIVTFVTIVTKNQEENKIAIEGEGKFIIPNLKVTIHFYLFLIAKRTYFSKEGNCRRRKERRCWTNYCRKELWWVQ